MSLMPPALKGGTMPRGPMTGTSLTPKSLGTLGPVISASRMPTRSPCLRKPAASNAAVVDLPTPPLPLITAIMDLTLFIRPASDCCAGSWRFWRNFETSRSFSCGVIAVIVTCGFKSAPNPATTRSTSAAIVLCKGQLGTVSATVTWTACPLILTSRTMPNSTILRWISGSMTCSKACMTCSTETMNFPPEIV
ncbi:MAG: hypothetical protein BWY63_02973 [Chloroflexi bacterium ADurb.Bin360]|nr:MAG: hypothetical protein BWY63_02973 [Chloroflexi bacterium ADurb.Bin360]